ncbi:hypothetical protein [Pseudarthrobacter sp. BIM B-2242]|uniref:hypothetical protein n=1 Tax=Pseudarthrobacter sp. BIM B-2242 TaxID=2772401 RepID=UPI00168B5E3A|nr:hypothetical protein [Pseudarthrobacter sp. BIM B-2242]QOD06145.1 hypothetical protein IDT60_21540 [Pseudarthrobacter sp. BIM B-2242]
MKRLAALLIAVPLLLTGCVVPYGGATPTATASAPPDGAKVYSTLDEAGIEQIKDDKRARLDMTAGNLKKSGVGLDDGAAEAPSVHITDGVMDLVIEAPYTDITAQTDRLRLNGLNRRADFTEVTYFLTAGSLEELSGLIRDGVGRYGIPSEPAERWIESISAKPDQRSDFAIAPGTLTGLQVTYDLRYDGSKETQVIIVHVSPLPSKTS